MAVPFDFVEGEVSQNILVALGKAKLSALGALLKEGAFRNEQFTSRSLLYKSIDAYAHATNHTLRFFLFGNEEPPTAYYTKADAYVIEILNSLTPTQLSVLKQDIRYLYYGSLMDTPVELSPNKRFIAVLRTKRKSGLPSKISEDQMYKFRKDVMAEVARYKASKYTNMFTFNSEYWVDLATLVGVSVRWILGVKETTLYCNSVDADDVFDLYTLMPPMKKYAFLSLLTLLSPTQNQELTALMERGDFLE